MRFYRRDEMVTFAHDRNLGRIDFEFKTCKATGRIFEVGYVKCGEEREVFCKSMSAYPGCYYLVEELP